MVILYSLPDLARSSATTLSQARNAHTFAVTTYTPIASKKGQADLSKGDGGEAEKVTKDLLVVGCRKKVVVYGAGRGGLKEAWVSVDSSIYKVVNLKVKLRSSPFLTRHGISFSLPPLHHPLHRRYQRQSTSSTLLSPLSFSIYSLHHPSACQ